MKIISADESATVLNAAEHIKTLLEKKPDAALALCGGKSTKALYRELGRMCRNGEISLKDASIFSVAELIGADEGMSIRAELERELFDNTDICPKNIFFPDPERPEEYDRLIEARGGIDLAVLGIGMNGQIGYNEPSTQFETYTRISKLTKRSTEHLGKGRGNIRSAVTMGIKTICSARDIIMLAFGEEKAEMVFKAVYGRTDSLIPAAFLQIPLQVTLYVDTAAAQQL